MAPDASAKAPTDEALEKIKAVVGDKGWTDEPDMVAPWLTDWRGYYTGQCALMVRPATTEEVAQVVAVCAAHDIAIVPQGGNTSMCAAATPHPHGCEILLNLGRLNRIRDIDPLNYTITVEAGCILQEIQQQAAEADRLFPLSLGPRGRVRSAATSRPMPGASMSCGMATRAISCSASKSCCPPARFGTACGGCARTTPATT